MADTMYTVKKGDTLSEIADKYGTTVAQLAKWNDIDDVNYIVVGQKLVVKSSSSGTAESAKTPADAKKPVIKTFGIQSGTDRTLYATWKWTGGVVKGSDRTDHYRVLWEYTTGDGIWFEGSDSTVTKKQSTYNAPSNAKKVRVRVKAIAKKHKVNKKEVAWFTTTDWSTIDGKVKAVTKLTDPIVIGQPPVPTVTIENYILTASVTNLAADINADEIMFEVVQDDVTVIRSAYPVDINLSTASMSFPIEAGHVYKARCVAYNSKEDEQSEWTDYSANVGTIPVGPNGFNSVEAASESSAKLTWTASLNATGYDIEYTSDRNYFDTSNQTQTLSIDGGGSTVGIVTGLETGKEWFFRIKAKNANGESGWSGISSVILGKDPAAPTTWSSSTTCTAGDAITLYWVHNSEDNSPQTSAEIKVSLLVGGSVISETTIPIASTDTDATKTYSYAYETNGLTENTRILWSVRTAGITGNYSEWSTVREINVYAPPTLILEITDQNGTAIETVTEYPIKVKATPGPASQNAVSMYLEVVANESYTTVDNIGNEQLVKKGDKVYSTVVDRPSTEYGCIFWLYPSSVNLDNNISYTVKCLVSMDTGLTAESSKEFTVSWTETQYVPNAEIGINKDDISAYIKPYVEASEDESDENFITDTIDTIDAYYWENIIGDIPDYVDVMYSRAVVYNDEIHILGGNTDKKAHYKWTGSEWVEVSTLPYDFYNGTALVWNNEIHILGGGQKSTNNHQKWTGSEWVEVSTLPFYCQSPNAVIYNDEIHILGGNKDNTKHYKWTGTEWVEVSTLPYSPCLGVTVVYNNEIHIIGGSSDYETQFTKHYKWTGSEWVEVSTLPWSFYWGSGVVFNNEIHLLGGGFTMKNHYKWNGTEWIEVSRLHYSTMRGLTVVYNNEIHVLDADYHYRFKPVTKYDIWNSSWSSIKDTPYSFRYASSVIYNNEIHILGPDEHHCKWTGSEWVEVSTLPYSFEKHSSVVYNNEIHILGSSDNPTSHYKWTGSEWVEVSTLPCDFYSGTALVWNNEIHIFGYNENSYHFKWDGSVWTEISGMNYLYYKIIGAVVCNNSIHILCNDSSDLRHYIYNGKISSEVYKPNMSSAYNVYKLTVYNNEIHTIAGDKHYKYDNLGWSVVEYLPFTVNRDSVCINKDEVMYALGIGDYYTNCKEFRIVPRIGEWVEFSTFPYNRLHSSLISYNNELHLIGGECENSHYKWTGTEWIQVSTLPYDTIIYQHFVVFNNEIHMLGGGDYPITAENAKNHYKWNGTEWIEVSTLPYYLVHGAALVYNNELYILGYDDGFNGENEEKSFLCKWTDSGWIKVSSLSYDFEYGTAVVYNDEIHILGGRNSYYDRTKHYKWTGSEWVEVSTLPFPFYSIHSIVYNNKLWIVGHSDYYQYGFNEYSFTFYWNGEQWKVPTALHNDYISSYMTICNDDLYMLMHKDTTGNDGNTLVYKFKPFDTEKPVPPVTLSVYRREFDGDFVEIAKGIKNGMNTYVIDPHPALDFARYRIVAIDNKTGAVSYNDPPGYPVGEKAIIIQWDEKWSNFDVDPDNEDALSNPPWTGSLLKLPYNIDVSDSNETDVSLVEYIGRKHPVSYYGTQRGETASWSVDIPKHDKDTLYALRRLRVYMGDVYVREPSGSGYWARIKVSFSQTHCETVIPVSIELTRVEGGK